MQALEALSPRDVLFASLDGQLIRGRDWEWRAEVVSIVDDSDMLWVQIGPAQDPTVSVVLRMDGGQPAERALAALRAWSDIPEDRRPTWMDVRLRS